MSFLLASFASACTMSQPSTSAAGPTGPAGTGVTVTVTPALARVPVGATHVFAATVTGSTNGDVNWSIQEGAAGGAVDGSGLYRAPAAPGVFHVVATSGADSMASQTAEVTVYFPTSVSVSVMPAAASLDACGTVALSASVSGGTGGVTWSLTEGAAGGSVTSAGTYTAPSAPGTFHVVATSVTDPTASAEATVTVRPERVLSVAVTPGSASVGPGSTLAFAAAVTTTCGTFAAQ